MRCRKGLTHRKQKLRPNDKSRILNICNVMKWYLRGFDKDDSIFCRLTHLKQVCSNPVHKNELKEKTLRKPLIRMLMDRTEWRCLNLWVYLIWLLWIARLLKVPPMKKHPFAASDRPPLNKHFYVHSHNRGQSKMKRP